MRLRATLLGAAVAVAGAQGVAVDAAVTPADEPQVQTLGSKVRALQAQIKRERTKHRLFRRRVAQELDRLHTMNHRLRRQIAVGTTYVSPRQSAWECIHRYEGAWNANTGNGYYGGLQMDMNFQRAYGSEYLQRYGTANNWPPSVQIEVADRAWRTRGFQPWPNTARRCGLL